VVALVLSVRSHRRVEARLAAADAAPTDGAASSR
jgi:hypothetical protein